MDPFVKKLFGSFEVNFVQELTKKRLKALRQDLNKDIITDQIRWELNR